MDSLKNTFPLDEKKAYGLYLPENPFTQNEAFVDKYVSTSRKKTDS